MRWHRAPAAALHCCLVAVLPSGLALWPGVVPPEPHHAAAGPTCDAQPPAPPALPEPPHTRPASSTLLCPPGAHLPHLPPQPQDPGKVFKGKKMPGRMGGNRVTVQNSLVWRVDPERNLLWVRGQVPGHMGNFVLVRDSAKKTLEQQPPRPVPTFLGAELPAVSVAPKLGSDPFEAPES